MENIPNRFPNQKAVEAFSSTLNDSEFIEFCNILKSRKWTKEEFVTRIQPLRPDLDLSAYTK